jgi:2-methylisocitrate lyase-like PEP mutase family enzyme
MFVVARRDSLDRENVICRARAFHEAGADAIFVDGLKDLGLLKELREELNCRLMFNQITGGKSPPVSLEELARTGVSLVNYSTPCLFAAQAAIDATMSDLKKGGGSLAQLRTPAVSLADCSSLLEENLSRCDSES